MKGFVSTGAKWLALEVVGERRGDDRSHGRLLPAGAGDGVIGGISPEPVRGHLPARPRRGANGRIDVADFVWLFNHL